VGIYTDSNVGYKKLAKLSRLCDQREVGEIPELQKFPTCERVICHAMSHYAAVFILRLRAKAEAKAALESVYAERGLSGVLKLQALDLVPEKARRLLEDPREWLEKSLIFFVLAMAFLRLTNMKSALFE